MNTLYHLGPSVRRLSELDRTQAKLAAQEKPGEQSDKSQASCDCQKTSNDASQCLAEQLIHELNCAARSDFPSLDRLESD
jgi:hypothetical protein